MYREYKSNLTMEDDAVISTDVQRIVHKCWQEVERQVVDYKNWTPRPVKSVGVMGWRTVRVFVSSTFSDFFSEREILVKHVFPELREWGIERKLRIVECDMRWGIPHDSTTSETIATCMEELDNCKDDNEGEPFFINLLGNRYGWIPVITDDSREVMNKYSWIDNTSITFMEILHGAYRTKNPNAMFCFRDSDFLLNIPEEFVDKFKEMGELGVEHLSVLKQKVKSWFNPLQVFHYSVTVEGVTSAMDSNKVQLGGLDVFAHLCLNFLKNAIEMKYPNQLTVDNLSLEDRETELQKLFLVEKAEFVVGREMETKQLLDYLGSPSSCDLVVQMAEKTGTDEDVTDTDSIEKSMNNLLCMVQADSGQGKTSLLSHLVLIAMEQGLNPFYHFCGSTVRSRHVRCLKERLLNILSFDQEQEINVGQLSLKEQNEMLEKLFKDAGSSPNKIIIIIDAVNELESDGDHLDWIPKYLPRNVSLIISCNQQPRTLERLDKLHAFRLNVGVLTDHHLQSIAVSYLSKYNKRLDEKQMNALMQNKHVNSPLWMAMICEELRVYGDFRTLTKKILSLPPMLHDLFGIIFKRLLNEDTTSCLRKVLCLISVSSFGIPQDEVLKVLGDTKMKEELAPLLWAQIKRNLKPYLRISGSPNEYLTFSHELIWKAVAEHVVEDNEKYKWQLHLADCYQYWCTNVDAINTNLPDLLISTHSKNRLIDFMLKDANSWKINSYRRSRLLDWCRCKTTTLMRSPPTPVYICIFCQYKYGCFNPANQRPCKDCCVICGGDALFQKKGAYLCVFHATGSHSTARCVACSGIVHTSMKKNKDLHGKLCHQCSFGINANMCAYVGEF